MCAPSETSSTPSIACSATTLPPETVVRERGAGRLRVEVPVAADDPSYDGHFPEVPILPGVRQLAWVVAVAGLLLPPEAVFAGLRRVKFLRPVVGGAPQRLDIHLECIAEGVRFHCTDAAGRPTASGVLCYRR